MVEKHDPVLDFEQALAAVRGHISGLSDLERDRVLDRIIPGVVPLFHASGVDEMHNHRYRERYLAKIIERMLARGKGLHGPDRLASLQIETKTVRQSGRTLSPSTGVGEIDKIHLKMGDPNYMGGKTVLLAAVFDAEHGITFACSVQPADLVRLMEEHVAPAAATLRAASADLTQKKRDAFRITLGLLMELPSFYVEHFDGSRFSLAPSLAKHPAFKRYKPFAPKTSKVS